MACCSSGYYVQLHYEVLTQFFVIFWAGKIWQLPLEKHSLLTYKTLPSIIKLFFFSTYLININNTLKCNENFSVQYVNVAKRSFMEY